MEPQSRLDDLKAASDDVEGAPATARQSLTPEQNAELKRRNDAIERQATDLRNGVIAIIETARRRSDLVALVSLAVVFIAGGSVPALLTVGAALLSLEMVQPIVVYYAASRALANPAARWPHVTAGLADTLLMLGRVAVAAWALYEVL